MTLPLIRLNPFYPGQPGVHGSDVPRGIRSDSAGLVLFVNPDAGDNADAHDGTDPEKPLTTIQGAIDKLVAHQTALAWDMRGSVIVCSGLAYDEAVTIPVTLSDCTLVGSGASYNVPTWASTAVATTPCLQVNGEGWVIEGFHFNPPPESAGIRLDWVPSTQMANETVIRGNYFNGAWTGRYGIEHNGSPFNVHVLDNWFAELNNAGANDAWAIYCSGSSEADPYMWEIARNRFSDSDNYIGSLNNNYGFNASLIKDNTFAEGILGQIVVTTYLDLRGGSIGYNTVTGNYFGGVYSQAGGYYANAATANSFWTGNRAEPTPATVADNGITVQVPA